MCRLLFLILLALPASAQTILVQNAALGPNVARFFDGVLVSPVASVAPGSIITLVPDPNRFDERRQVSVRVKPAGAGSEITLPVLPAPFFQIWALLPPDLALGPADLTLTVNGDSGTVRIQIVPNAIGLFDRSGFGFGSALATNEDVSVPPAINRLTNPAIPGQYVTLWGTGLGKAPNGAVTVKVGGRPVTSSYAGPAPGFPGVDQINFPLPADAPDGCYVSIVVEAGESISNELTIAKASLPGSCQHPLGLSPADLQALDAGGGVLFASIRIQTELLTLPPDNTYMRFETAQVTFLNRGDVAMSLMAPPLTADESYFTCTLRYVSGPFLGFVDPFDNTDVGEKLILSGAGKTLDLTRPGPVGDCGATAPSAPAASAKDLPPSFFSPGPWQFSSAGGRTIGAFQQSLLVPPGIRWTNRDSLATIDRSKDQTITWNPDSYTDADVFTVILSSTNARVVCRARATAGTITLPSKLLQQIAPAAVGAMELFLAPHPYRRTVFSLPLVNGGAVPAVFDYSFSETLLTTIQ